MAKKISDEQLKLSIIIDGNSAQKELLDLEKNTRDLTARNKELRAEKAKLEKQGKQDTAQYKEYTREIKQNSTAINANKAKMKELQDQIGLTGLTMKQLGDKSVHLKMVLRNLVPGSEDYKRYEKDLKAVTDRINELRGHGQQAGFSIGGLADKFNRYAALGASIIAAGTGVVLSMQKIIDYNGKLSDAISNVQKTTGMTKLEVDELAKSFGLLKTRTGRIELLGIAEAGGRLGIAKEEMADFVRVMDKSAVALGDSFEGGPDVVAEKLGRIKGLYKELKDAGVESAFESVGSALNDLGADGTASEANVAEFVTRIGAMPAALKPSIQTALGLGAAFEESGLKAEVAAGNYGKVVAIAARDIDAFALVMQRPRKELEDLINSDPNEFFLQFASALKGLDATQLAQVLDYLKLNDNEVKMVLGAASENVDMFRDKIRLAGESMRTATSLTNEYEIKNNNLAATLDRLKKTVVGWFSSDTVVAWLTAAVNSFARLIGAVDDNSTGMTVFRNTLVFTVKALFVIAAAMLSTISAMKLTALWTSRNTEATLLYNLMLKARAVAEGTSIVLTQAWAAAQMLLTGNIKGATQAIRVMAATMKTTPFGLLIGLVAAVSAAYVAFSDSADEAAKQQKVFSDLSKEAESSIKKEKDQLAMLVKVAQDKNASDELRKKAIEDINKIHPELLGNITLENIGTDEGKKLLDQYILSLEKAARAKAVASKITELYSQLLDVEKSSIMDNVEWYNHLWAAIKSGGNTNLMAGYTIQAGAKNKAAAAKDIQDVLDELLKEQMQQYKDGVKDGTVETTVTGKGVLVPDAAGDKERQKAAEKARREHEARMKDLEKQIEELRELERKGLDDKLGLMKDGFEKEVALQNENHRRKLQDLTRQLIAEKDILEADKKINDPKSSKLDVHFWTKQKEVWLEKNKHLNTMIRLEESIHFNKLGAIVENENKRQIKALEEKYKREKVVKETGFLEELNAIHTLAEAKSKIGDFISKKELDQITTLEEAKKVLKEKYQKEELERELKYIEESIAKMEQQIQAIPFKGMDLNLLTPEQREQIEKDIEFAKNAAEKIKDSINNKEGENSEPQSNEPNDLGVNIDTDILGFSADQWEKFFDNLKRGVGGIQDIAMATQALQNLWATYDNYVSAAENRQLKNFEEKSNAKQRKLKWQLDNGYINQQQYNRQTEQMEADLNKKKAEIEYKQAKRKKAMAIADTVINTATAIMQAYAQLGPIGGSVAAGLIGALGLAQLITIMKEPLPAKGYEEGLYQDVKREQDGKVFRSRYGGKTKTGMVHRPTYFLTGENGPEMIIDSKAYRQLSPEVKDVLWRELRGIKGFQDGLYNEKNQRFEVPVSQSTPSAFGNMSRDELLIAALNRNSEVLEKVREEGLVAYYSRDFRDIKKFKDDIDKIDKSREKAAN